MPRYSLLISALFISVNVVSQDQQQVGLSNLREKKVCFLGLDFSMGRLLSVEAFRDTTKLINEFVPEWNRFFYSDQDKFDVCGAFRLKSLDMCTENCSSRNRAISAEDFIQDDSHSLTEDDIRSAVVGFNYTNVLADVGILFVVEYFDKREDEAAIWVTLIDLTKMEVFLAKRVTGKPGGMGMKSYWANAVYEVILRIQKKDYKRWLKETKVK